MALSSATHSHATSTHPPDCRLSSHDDGQVRSSHTRGFKHSDDGSFSSTSVRVNINLFPKRDVWNFPFIVLRSPIERKNITRSPNKSCALFPILKTFDLANMIGSYLLSANYINGTSRNCILAANIQTDDTSDVQ